MSYYINDSLVTLNDLLKRIKDTDLIPSRLPLLVNIDERFSALEAAGIKTLADFRKAVKSSKSFERLTEKTGIDKDYLLLLRREAEGYFPKAFPITDFGWLDKTKLSRLCDYGYPNSITLYEALESPDKRKEIYSFGEVDSKFVYDIFCLLDLTRIQWVSPLTARLLFDADCKYARDVALADAELLCEAVDKINEEKKYFKGKIGLRDIKRLVKAAEYVK